MSFSFGRKNLIKAVWLLLCVPLAAAAGQELLRARETAALGSEARALDLAMKGLKQAPLDSELFLYAVTLLPEQPSQQAAALAALARAGIKRDAANYVWHLGLCKTTRVAGHAQAAVASCRRTLDLEPALYLPYKELGLTYAADGNSAKAAEIFQRGVDVAPSNYQAHYQLAKALENSSDLPGSRKSYTLALSLAGNSGDLDAKYYRALITAGLKRLQSKTPKPRAAAQKQATPGKEPRYAACLKKFGEEKRKDNLQTAADTGLDCRKLMAGDPQLAEELAPLLVRLGRYEEGVKEYERAAALYGPPKKATAFLRAKAAETWLKIGNSSNAAAQYLLAAQADPADMKLLKALAGVFESRSDFKSALETYQAILKHEPANTLIKTRVEELKSGQLTEEQILDELKIRMMIYETKLVLQPEDIQLFKAVRAAEISGGVDYILGKALSPGRLYLERKDPDGTIKVLLTHAGYKTYIFHATRDAIAFFEAQKISLNDVFKLRTLTGDPIFDAHGRITPEGAEAWRKALTGTKTWLLPYEPVPKSPKAIQAGKEIAEAQGAGYREISEPEYLWLTRATDCPANVLRDAPLSMKFISDGTVLHYMLCYVSRSECMNGLNEKLTSYIETYRSGDTQISDTKTSTAFFGTGGVKKHRFCENGKIWDGQ